MCGRWTGGRTQPSLKRFSRRQTSPPAETGSICRRNFFSSQVETRNPNRSLAPEGSRILQRRQSGSSQASSTELCTTGDMSPLLTAVPETTTSKTLRLTQPYLTTPMTLSPYRATRMNLCSHQVSDCPVYSRAREGEVVGRRWRSHATSRTHSASGQYPSSTISTSRTVLRTTGSQGNKCLTCWRWRMTSFADVFERSRPPQRCRGPTGASDLTSCATSPLLLTCRPTVRSSLSNCFAAAGPDPQVVV